MRRSRSCSIQCHIEFMLLFEQYIATLISNSINKRFEIYVILKSTFLVKKNNIFLTSKKYFKMKLLLVSTYLCIVFFQMLYHSPYIRHTACILRFNCHKICWHKYKANQFQFSLIILKVSNLNKVDRSFVWCSFTRNILFWRTKNVSVSHQP